MDGLHSSHSGDSFTPINSDTDYNSIPRLQVSPKTEMALILMMITIGSLLGTLIRLTFSTVHIDYFDGVNNSDLISNLLGLMIVGMNQGSVHKSKQFNAFVETGLCDSLTSWSSWVTSVIISSQQFGYDQLVITFFVTFALFNFSFQFGSQIGEPLFKRLCNITISLSNTVTFLILLSIVSLLYIFILLANQFFLTQNSRAFIWEISLIICPLASFLRYFLQQKINSFSWLPFGTLIANLAATFFGSLIVRYDTYESTTLNILQFGIIGTLGTLSQWVKQEHSFRKLSQKWIYGMSTIGLSFLFSFTILYKY